MRPAVDYPHIDMRNFRRGSTGRDPSSPVCANPMLNSSADYALRAVLFLARHAPNGGQSRVEAIAAATGVPRNYLGKVLHALARARVVTSVRGPRGGFRLAKGPCELTVADVTDPFQQISDRAVCLLGNRPCDPDRPCDAHLRWRRMAQPVERFLHETTIAELVGPLDDPAPGARLHRATSEAGAGGPAVNQPA
jgi:Rrf2 family transcriptional regulator, iron-sulfur cluster assembly transcription factor